jgi:conjugative relaxase-like TrwC/TraI family protein
MLRVIQNQRVDVAKGYYSTADYFSEGQELTGHWRGKAAIALGLEGEVQKADWDALCDNLHPHTGTQLTARLRDDRTIGYDFNFHVPKSLSMLYAMTRDERLLDAFRDSMHETMKDIETEMAARVRKNGRQENRITGNMVWGEYVHFTSRPVEGEPDAHLHGHCFVFNVTHDYEEQIWKAGQFRDLKRDSPYFEAVFHSRLTHRLTELGLPVERTAKGWELGGVPQSLIDKFSRRTQQIEEKARQKGITDPELKSALGAKTRQLKVKDLSFPELQDRWRARMSPLELEALAVLEHKTGDEAPPPDETASGQAMAYALSHCFERASVVPERTVLAAALRQSVGQATVEQVHQAAERSDLIVGQRFDRKMATTRQVLKEEKRVVDFARDGRGCCEPLGERDHQFKRDWLNAGQKHAVQHILDSNDRVIVLRGAAGVGKTTLLQEAVEAIEARGVKVHAFAPSADASRGTLRAAGFKEADTVKRLLMDKSLQKQLAGQLIWVDEAGTMGTEMTAELFALASRVDARLLLSGDRKQHHAVSRGDALRLLEDEAGIVPADVKEIQRQSGKYKAAVKALSEGRAGEGFDQLDDLGWVREIDDEQRYAALAADYVATIEAGRTALVVSPTHAENQLITQQIRRSLQAAGLVADADRTFTVLENAGLTEAQRGDFVNYEPGQVLQFHQNAKGFTRGDRVIVGDDRLLPLDHPDRFAVFRTKTISLALGDLVRITHNGSTADQKHRLDNGTIRRIDHFESDGTIVFDNGWKVGKDFGHLTHGYVVTSHASQSKTVDHVFVGQSSKSFPASSREQFYVSCSRARNGVVIYTDDKEALREAIAESDERLTATEFVNGPRPRETVALLQRTAEARRAEPTREKEVMEYER